jgi:hypothetical protein
LVLGVLAACEAREQPADQPPSAAARPTTAAREDWSLYSAKPNAQDELIVDDKAIAAAHTDWPLVVAQLMELRRSGKTLDVRLALRNEGVELQKPMFLLGDVYVIDKSSAIRYGIMREDGRFMATTNAEQPDRFYKDVEPGQTIVALMRFAAPPPEVTLVDLEIPNIRALERLTIQDQ